MHWLMNTESGFCLIAIAAIISYVAFARHYFRVWGNQAAVQMRVNYKKSQEVENIG